MAANKRELHWRSTSYINNLWSSAVLALFAAIAITVFGGLAFGNEFEAFLLKDYLWIFLLLLFLFFFVTRLPREPQKVKD